MADAIARNARLRSEGTAKAWATVLAVERPAPGIYNIADPGPQVDTAKARTRLDWRAGWRIG